MSEDEMTQTHVATLISGRKDWRTALAALRRLLADADDTAQVFRIMRALNAGVAKAGYDRLLRTPGGGEIACRQVELAERLSEPGAVSGYAAGSVGAAYRSFLEETGYSAMGLAAISRSDDPLRDARHPYAWYGRRTRDVHDIWHILTGYRADDPLGEACLTAFSYAQTGGLGWAAIAAGAALQNVSSAAGRVKVRAIWEGYRHGRRAAWLLGEEYELLLAEPLEAARGRLRIAEPVAYLAASAAI
ncbi:Coq4 family protein [Sphingomonas sp. BIUV-7]|uniref:Coq4 family protein n=2 Tax=Sphingomonas natans TaxID=3063330 RepID=A0ABT8YB19_9SPHN|nr:Coq4 family protein [Sphingomonas sp. BIUV-7]